MADRLKRLCDSCGQYDDHPRHVVASTPDANVSTPEFIAKATKGVSGDEMPQVIADLMDTSVVMKHLDCCRTDGCPDGSCAVVTAGAENLKGAKLVEHLVTLQSKEA